MAGWGSFHTFTPKKCALCSEKFTPKSGAHRFCGAKCKGAYKYTTGKVTTWTQYALISGNWKRYVARLMYFGGRKRDKLNREIILRLLEQQDYKCALTGIPLTCKLELGVACPTNASIDRIFAGGTYTENNIRIVCRAVNSWRSNIPTSEFVWWCQQVVNHNKDKEHSDGRELEAVSGL